MARILAVLIVVGLVAFFAWRNFNDEAADRGVLPGVEAEDVDVSEIEPYEDPELDAGEVELDVVTEAERADNPDYDVTMSGAEAELEVNQPGADEEPGDGVDEPEEETSSDTGDDEADDPQ